MRKQWRGAGANWNYIYLSTCRALVGHIRYCLRALASTKDSSKHSVPLLTSDGPDGDRANTRSGSISFNGKILRVTTLVVRAGWSDRCLKVSQYELTSRILNGST
jgi:hypothetical protein